MASRPRPLHDAVDTLGAADVGNAETRDGGVGAEAVDLLVERHEREEVVDALRGGQGWVAEGILRCLLRGGSERERECERGEDFEHA